MQDSLSYALTKTFTATPKMNSFQNDESKTNENYTSKVKVFFIWQLFHLEYVVKFRCEVS